MDREIVEEEEGGSSHDKESTPYDLHPCHLLQCLVRAFLGFFGSPTPTQDHHHHDPEDPPQQEEEEEEEEENGKKSIQEEESSTGLLIFLVRRPPRKDLSQGNGPQINYSPTSS